MHHHTHNALPVEYQGACARMVTQWTDTLQSTFLQYNVHMDADTILEAATSLFEAVYVLHCALLAKAPTPLIHRSGTHTLDDYVELVGREENDLIPLESVRMVCCVLRSWG